MTKHGDVAGRLGGPPEAGSATGGPGVPGAVLRMLAPAKLNLYLDVLGKRPDGYHELESLFVALTWGDDLELAPQTTLGVTLRCLGEPGVPSGPENLALRAAAGWLEALGARAPFPGVALTLEKRIPMGGGLGGGSSDAGAVLRALEALAGPGAGLGAERVQVLAAALGADVPFFLHVGSEGGAALGRGRGDRIEALAPAPGLDVVLVTPPWGHVTAQVFAHAHQRLRQRPEQGLEEALAARASGVAARVRAAHWNALALPAMRAYPAFTRFTSEVERRLGRAPCLSGSGSTLFDVADDHAEAQAQARRLEGLGARVVVARTT